MHTAVGDSKYGTAENLARVEKNIAPHLGVLADKQKSGTERADHYDDTQFAYDAARDTYTCRAGQTLRQRRYHERRSTYDYTAAAGVCAACPQREKCTSARTGRTLQRHEQAARVALGKQIARREEARRDRRRHHFDGRQLWLGGWIFGKDPARRRGTTLRIEAVCGHRPFPAPNSQTAAPEPHLGNRPLRCARVKASAPASARGICASAGVQRHNFYLHALPPRPFT
ncbi:MAG TPA: hypothetical protein VNT99_05635 [Methylomirabilota bacterium]|nr:hypothetical protein [Methylomirabilota bacterium]